MPVLSENTDRVQFEGWTLRARAASVRPARLLVMVHGWTGTEDSMWVFARFLPENYWVIAPRAPYAAEPSGYSWRSGHADGDGHHTLEALRPSGEALLQLVDDYSRSVGVDARLFDLIGFSQGAALVSVVAMLHPERIRKLGILAGFVPRGMDDLVLQRPLQGKSVFVSHGTLDPLVPVERARASIKLLERAGAKVTYCEEEVGHKISSGCVHALTSYLKD
ncbi:MAG: alpha/beta hydrolase [Bacteroidota bacterium]